MDNPSDAIENATEINEQDVLPQLLVRRQQLLASSNTRQNLLLECATILFDNERNIEDGLPSHGGSRPGKKPNIPQDFEGSYLQLHHHYFSDNCLYNNLQFRRRFRMCRPLFLRISKAIPGYDAYFTHRADALGKLRLHPVVKITAALRMLAYGAVGDCNNEYLQISETTSLKSMDLF